MFDTDPEGENGARKSFPVLAQHGPVQYAWSASMHDGQFKNSAAGGVSAEKLRLIRDSLGRHRQMNDNHSSLV